MLQLVAVPIGDPGDITFRAVTALREADVVIGEERREVSKLLKALGIEGKTMELLNEHSREGDVRDLLELCRNQRVALVSDCGTPGFCDPGAKLVAACRAEKIRVTPLPGASSLMCLLAITGFDFQQFLFRGFLPADREERSRAMKELAREPRPIVLMDTPYRLNRLLDELAKLWPERSAVIGLNFTQENEEIFEGRLADLPKTIGERKAEFIMMVKASPTSGLQRDSKTPPTKALRPGPRRPVRGRRNG